MGAEWCQLACQQQMADPVGGSKLWCVLFCKTSIEFWCSLTSFPVFILVTDWSRMGFTLAFMLVPPSELGNEHR